jgi:transposase
MKTSGFTKICSSCGELQTYTTKNRLKKSIKENSVCNKCSSVRNKKIYNIEVINQVVKQYVNGDSVSKIAFILKISKRNIKPILIDKNVWVENRDEIKKIFNEHETNDIINKYINEKLSCQTIAKYYNVSNVPIKRILKEKGLLRKGLSDGVKINLTDEQFDTIRNLYLNENKNGKDISQIMNLSVPFVGKILSNSNYRRSMSEAISLRQTGKKRSERVCEILKKAQQNYAKSGKRKQCGGVCRKFLVKNISCQGTYEKYYIEKLIKEGKNLPNNSKPINTPYGVYYPDFSSNDKLIEIKCDYTYDVLIGEKQSRWTKKIDTMQYDKIKWVNKNVKPVEILIVDKKNNKLIKKEIV